MCDQHCQTYSDNYGGVDDCNNLHAVATQHINLQTLFVCNKNNQINGLSRQVLTLDRNALRNRLLNLQHSRDVNVVVVVRGLEIQKGDE